MENLETSFPCIAVAESIVGGRQENQDSFGSCDTPSGLVIAVCDGMGGLSYGKLASQIAVSSILSTMSVVDENQNPVDYLASAVKKANSDILKFAQQNGVAYQMGCTATVLLLCPEYAVSVNVGDSRIYQFRNSKKVFRTFDDSAVFELVKNHILTEEEARRSNQSNIITKALGIADEVTPTIDVLPYMKNDFFMLCTDGFWGCLPEKSLMKMVFMEKDLSKSLFKSVMYANHIGETKGGTHDNITAVMVKVNKESKLKVKMSKKNKLLFAVVLFLLVASVILNVVQCRHSQSQDVATEVIASDVINNESEDSKAAQMTPENLSTDDIDLKKQ